MSAIFSSYAKTASSPCKLVASMYGFLTRTTHPGTTARDNKLLNLRDAKASGGGSLLLGTPSRSCFAKSLHRSPSPAPAGIPRKEATA